VKIETILSPSELPSLTRRDLREIICVVFDILRATSTFITALQNGAEKIIPVSEIAEAVALKKRSQDFLLAGERNGLKISAAQSGGVDFDFGNSPREFLTKKIRGKTVVSTTTNGTRALRACAGAKIILASSFLNLSATAKFLRAESSKEILLVCAGTGENVALEDVLAAGALIEMIDKKISAQPQLKKPKISARRSPAPPKKIILCDSSEIARQTFLQAKSNLFAAISNSENARRLLLIPELRDDVKFCLQRDVFDFVAHADADGALRRI
jgi:2-phosphosulfolactate phosphatase